MTVFRFSRPGTPFAHSSTGRSSVPWHPGALVVAALVALLVASPALSAVRIGTDAGETLVGTVKTDQITGNGGNDALKGKAGNDTYVFADNWGTDTLVEKAGEGIDTVDFHAVTTGPVSVGLIPEWVDVDPALYNIATGPGGEVRFAYNVNGQTSQSVVENAIGGRGDGDAIQGGAGKSILQPGGGALDWLADVGGRNDGPGGFPDLPVSNDVYKGFATNTGTDIIQDWGGNGDVLDLRPFATTDVFATAVDLDGSPSTLESLQVVTGFTGQIIIVGQFGDLPNTVENNFHGHIETIRFADTTFSTASALQSMTAASTEAPVGKQARLAEVAEELAKEARAQFAEMPELGARAGSGGAGAEGGPKPGGEPAKSPKADTKHTHATKATPEKQPPTKATHEKKQATKTPHEKKHAPKATRENKHVARATQVKRQATEPRAQRW